MFDFGLDESNACIPTTHRLAATVAARKFTGRDTHDLEQALSKHFLTTKTDPSSKALVINEYTSVKQYPEVEAFCRALAQHIKPLTGERAYLVWGCSDFVERWYFQNGQLEVEYTVLNE